MQVPQYLAHSALKVMVQLQELRSDDAAFIAAQEAATDLVCAAVLDANIAWDGWPEVRALIAGPDELDDLLGLAKDGRDVATGAPWGIDEIWHDGGMTDEQSLLLVKAVARVTGNAELAVRWACNESHTMYEILGRMVCGPRDFTSVAHVVQ